MSQSICQKPLDEVHALVKQARWVYEKAFEEGFSIVQSLEISKKYMETLLLMAETEGTKKTTREKNRQLYGHPYTDAV